MILVYPMLTSASVNPNILPGLIKAIEKYIIVYQTDEMINTFNSAVSDVIKAGVTGAVIAAGGLAAAVAAEKIAKHMRIKGGKFELTEQKKNIPDMIGTKTADTAAKYTAKGLKAAGIKPEDIEATKAGAEKQLKSIEKRTGVTGFEMPRHDALALEPHWVRVDTAQGAKFLGVKVVPFKVTSTTGMVGLLLSDKELKKMSYLSNRLSRTITRVFFRFMRGIKIPGIKDKPISGNPKTDIIWATSKYGANTFICLSMLDLEQEDVFTSPKVVQRLHKLGWASLIITDDVNKQATFCMKQFGGICSTVPYAFLYSSLGKEHGQVYKDMEDAQRSAGPFFRKRSTTKRKLFSDAKVIAKLNKYSTLKE